MEKFWNWTSFRNEAGEEQRELHLEGVIAEESWWDDDVTPAMFREELMAGSGPIVLHISSPGGDCIAASRIYTMLMDYPGDVTVQIDGLAASAASVVAMAGTTVRMSPTALMMIHNPMTCAFGDEAEMKAAISVLSEVKESIMNAYNIKTGLPFDKLAKMMDAETWMDAKKAKALGFVDEILYADGEDSSRPEDVIPPAAGRTPPKAATPEPEEEEEEEEKPAEPAGADPEEKPEEEPEEDPEEKPEEEPEEDPEEEPEEDPEEEEEKEPENIRLLKVAARSTSRLVAACLMDKVHRTSSFTAKAAPEKAAPAAKKAPVIEDRLNEAETKKQQSAVITAFAKKELEGKSMNIKNLRGGYFKSAMTRQPLSQELRNELTITTGANPGNGLLPVEVSRSLIGDIYGEDKFLSAIMHTQIKGLRLPKVTTTPATDGVRSPDGTTLAGETTLADETINFGRFPGREKIVVPTAILGGTETDLDAFISARLQYDHRRNLRSRIFNASATGEMAHMSVYSKGAGNPALPVSGGSDTLDAVQQAIAALPEGVRENAKVVMTYAQWMEMIKTLANGATALFGAPTKEMLGFEVITCDYVAAAGMLVGDLSAIHVNYDDPLRLKTDEDIDLDMTKIVIAYDYDIHVEDANRLRLAKVSG